MTIRLDSYSSVDEIKAFTKHLLDGQSTFNSTTRPTATEVEKFIDRASGVLNTALAVAGLSAPITNSTAKLACDDWVTARGAEYTELTQRGVGYSEGEGSRVTGFRNLYTSAGKFVSEMRLGFIRMGVAESHTASEGLQFTGLDAVSQRDDPSDASLEQPLFTRDLFKDPTKTRYNSPDESEDD